MSRASAADSLPVLGLGLAANLDEHPRPNPHRLAEEQPKLFDFIEYSAPFSLEEARRSTAFVELEAKKGTLPALFHPVHLNLAGPELESAERLRLLAEHLKAVQSPWVGNDVAWWHVHGTPFPGYLYLPPSLDSRGLDEACAHAEHVQAALPVPLLLENPAVLVRDGDLHVLDFMARLHQRTGLELILDLGHLWGFQLLHGLPTDAAFDGFPFEAVREIHLAGGAVSARGERRFYFDDHTQPVREELFTMLEQVLKRCTRLCALVFEGDGHPAAMAARTLERLRRGRVVTPPNSSSREGGDLAPPRARSESVAKVATPEEGRARLARAYGGAPHPSDLEGQRADIDYRLAIVVERLDRIFPWTRRLLTPDREWLVAFTSSPEFGSLFEGRERTLGQVFASYARRRVRELGGDADALAAVLSFESWALHTVHHAEPAGLMPGVHLGTFAVDLSEMAFAERASRRHLLGRAWANGILEVGAVEAEALAQVAKRAPPKPWSLALRAQGEGFEVVLLSPQLFAFLQRHIARGGRRELADEPSLWTQAVQLGLVSV